MLISVLLMCFQIYCLEPGSALVDYTIVIYSQPASKSVSAHVSASNCCEWLIQHGVQLECRALSTLPPAPALSRGAAVDAFLGQCWCQWYLVAGGRGWPPLWDTCCKHCTRRGRLSVEACWNRHVDIILITAQPSVRLQGCLSSPPGGSAVVTDRGLPCALTEHT